MIKYAVHHPRAVCRRCGTQFGSLMPSEVAEGKPIETHRECVRCESIAWYKAAFARRPASGTAWRTPAGSGNARIDYLGAVMYDGRLLGENEAAVVAAIMRAYSPVGLLADLQRAI